MSSVRATSTRHYRCLLQQHTINKPKPNCIHSFPFRARASRACGRAAISSMWLKKAYAVLELVIGGQEVGADVASKGENGVHGGGWWDCRAANA